MRMKKWAFLVLISMLILGGCGFLSPAQQADTKVKEKEAEEKEPEQTFQPPTTSREREEILADKGEGRFAGDRFDEKKVYQALDEMPEGLTDEGVYGYLLELVGENYRGFKEAFDAMEKPDYSQDLGKLTALQKESNNEEVEKKVNVQILLDASGSMIGRVDGEIKMDLAKKAVQEFASSLPSHAEVSLRVYGHKGSNSKKDKKVSCASNEMVYPFKSYDQGDFQQALNKFKPTGWTPLAAAIRSAKEDLQKAEGEHRENILYIVSDGVETCGGDPVEEAKKLHQSNIKAVVNIIGFDVDHAGQQALKKVARAGGGTYQTVEDRSTLNKAFERHSKGLNAANNNAFREAVDRIDTAYQEDNRQNNRVREEMLAATKRERSRMNAMLDDLAKKGKVNSDQWATIGNWNNHDRWAALGNYADGRWQDVGSAIDKELQSSYNDAKNQWIANGKKIDEADETTRIRVGGHRMGKIRMGTIRTPPLRLPWGAPKPEN